MSYSWKQFKIERFYGLDLKTNILQVKDGKSLDLQDCYQSGDGIVKKRPGGEVMFTADETGSIPVDQIGSCTLSGTKYYFKFVNGTFKHSLTKTGAATTISPAPAISTTNPIWYAVIDDKLFFVDGSNDLRYFNGTTISASAIYARPTVAPTTASVGAGFDFVYTVDNGRGESPALATALSNKVSTATIRVPTNTGPQTLIAGDVVRIYSRATAIAAASQLVATYTILAADVTATFADIATSAISDTQTQLYSELGVALNKTAPTALKGICVHYGRLVGWKGSRVYNSKSSNPHSWPDDSAQREAFVYGFGLGDGEDLSVCISYRESLYVMKPSNVAVFGGIGPDDTGNNAYSFRRLETNGRGCIAGKTAAVIGEKSRTYLIYLSRQGFMASDGSDPNIIGDEIESEIQGQTSTTLELSVAGHDTRLGLYVCFVGGAASKTGWVFDVREDGDVLVGWWKWSGLNVKSMAWDGDRFLFGMQEGVSISQRVAGTSSDYSDVEQEYVAAAAVTTATDLMTVTGTYATGDEVVVRTNGTIPAGLTANTTYYVISVSATTIKLATTLANALAGTAIDITTQGAGTHSIVGSKAIDGYYTTNWLDFGSASLVKKVGKPAITFNALASAISVVVSFAYDWSNQFEDSITVTSTSSHAWGDGTWGSFVWGEGSDAAPKNLAIPRRKFRSVRYKFRNNTINQDFDLLGLEQPYDYIRNRGNFA